VFPLIVVALIYKVAHYEDWTKGDVLMLLGFQLVTGLFAALLLVGHFQAAVLLLVVFVAFLGLIASFAKSL
jgi:hypothetical protein